MKQFIATKALIFNNGRLLILRESSVYGDGTNQHKYDLPGGRLTPGEHFLDALSREVKEETGLEIAIGKPVTVSEWRPIVRDEECQVAGIFFECQSKTDEITLSSDHDHFEWINPTDYEKYPLIDNLKPVFEKYIKDASMTLSV